MRRQCVSLYTAADACGAAEILRQVSQDGVEAAALYDSLHWLHNPVRELRCIKAILKPGGRLLVGQQVADSMPGLAAINVALGAKHVFHWREVELALSSAGFRLERRLLRYMPCYMAVWAA
jgi:SAM-dependent methyltransferase